MRLISVLKLFSRNCSLEKEFSESGPASSGEGTHVQVQVVEGRPQIQCHWVFMNQRDEIDARELALSSENLQPGQ